MIRKLAIITGLLLCLPSLAAAEIGISQITDFSLPSWSIGDGNINSHIDVCVFSSSGKSGDYAITVAGSSGYVLTNGSSQIPYALTWDDSGAGSLGQITGTTLNNNLRLSGQVNGNTKSATCSGNNSGPNARLSLKINEADMAAALAGTYSGAVTIIVSAN